jgi:hypothetical protein
VAAPTQLNVLEAVLPKNEIAKTMTAAIIPSITAYSTALAPRSERIAQASRAHGFLPDSERMKRAGPDTSRLGKGE